MLVSTKKTNPLLFFPLVMSDLYICMRTTEIYDKILQQIQIRKVNARIETSV